MNKQALFVAVLLLLGVSVCTANEGDKWRALPNESTWQWLVRVRMCTTGDCQNGDHGSMAFMNWGDDTPPVYDNVEMEPDEKLVSSYPFREPSPSEPFYDERAEESIQVHDNYNGWIVSRMFRRGVFVGYLVWRPPVTMVVI